VGMTDTAPQDSEPTAAQDARRWRVRVVHSPDTSLVGRWFELDNGLTLGRKASGPLGAIDDRRLSGTHATIDVVVDRVQRALTLEARDRGSRNGMFVDGVRVERAALSPSQVLRVGDTFIVVDRVASVTRSELFDDATELRGDSSVFLDACRHAKTGAVAGLRVLLLGESGVGKELFAQAVHHWHMRSGPFVPVNTASLGQDLAELLGSADTGTVFFDEVAELARGIQPKLLRVLETCEVTPVGSTTGTKLDLYIVSATNAHLPSEVTAGTFRRDLYARIAEVIVHLPPLRERRADLIELFQYFAGPDVALTASFVDAALTYAWPYNIRELRLVARRLAGVTTLQRHHLDEIVAEHATKTAPTVGAQTAVVVTPRTTSKNGKRKPPVPSPAELESALRAHSGNVARCASQFGRDPRQIYRWIERWHIDLASIR